MLIPGIADAPLASYRLVEYILFSLSKEGWGLAMSAGMPGKHNTRETFFFQPMPRRERRFFSVLFGTHMVTLLDAPDQRVCEAFVQAIGVSDTSGICPTRANLADMASGRWCPVLARTRRPRD